MDYTMMKPMSDDGSKDWWKIGRCGRLKIPPSCRGAKLATRFA